MMFARVHIEMDTDCILFRSMVQKGFSQVWSPFLEKALKKRLFLTKDREWGKTQQAVCPEKSRDEGEYDRHEESGK